jgi:hypothetical protein
LGNRAAITTDFAFSLSHERWHGDAIIDVGNREATGEEVADIITHEVELEAVTPT